MGKKGNSRKNANLPILLSLEELSVLDRILRHAKVDIDPKRFENEVEITRSLYEKISNAKHVAKLGG